MAETISLSLNASSRLPWEACEGEKRSTASSAAICCASKLSGGGKEVWRRGCEDEVVLAIEGFLLLMFCGRAREGRWRGNASGGGPGGEVAAEPGGDAMVVGRCY